jgi:putative DNA primase/helicase
MSNVLQLDNHLSSEQQAAKMKNLFQLQTEYEKKRHNEIYIAALTTVISGNDDEKAIMAAIMKNISKNLSGVETLYGELDPVLFDEKELTQWTKRISKMSSSEALACLQDLLKEEDTDDTDNTLSLPDVDWWEENQNGTKTLKHDVLAEYVIQKRIIVRYPDAHGDLYYYNHQSGLYELDKTCRQIRSFIRSEDDFRRNQIREVQEYIEDMCPIADEISQEYIGVGNGLLRLSDMAFKPFTPNVFITFKIPTNYNQDAYDEFVADTLFKVSCGHAPTMENLAEMFGAVLYPKLLVPKMFYLYGRSAHNGKSSILFMIHQTFNNGCNNISAVSPQKLASNTFAGSSIYGKIANIVDDLPDEQITDSGTFKSIITGGYIDIEAKNQASKTVRMSTVCITASNHFPNFREAGTQINKRLHIIPFDHDFTQDEDALPEMETMKRLETQQAKEYVLRLAVQAAKDMLNRKESLTHNDKAESTKNDFAEANDPLSDFFYEYDKEFFEESRGVDALKAYDEWCRDNYVNHQLGAKRFKESVCAHYNMEWKTKKIKFNGNWKAVKGFKSKNSNQKR